MRAPGVCRRRRKPQAAGRRRGFPQQRVWIDVSEPTPDEQKAVEQVVGGALRVPEEPARFQISTPVRSSSGALTLTALLIAGLEDHRPHLMTVQFIKSKGPLVTVSKGDPQGLAWLARECGDCVPSGSRDPFLVLLDLIIEHATDALDHVGEDLDRLNGLLFQHHVPRKRRLRLEASPRRRNRQLERLLTELGHCREVLVKLRRSVLSLRRVVILLRERDAESAVASKLESFEHELKALAEAEEDLSATTSFMLDGAVGFIGILQSRIINIMTIVGVLLTPPVLVASVYGMNFKHMPELDWAWGYAWGLGLMVLSALVTYVVVRVRGWI
jgi:magnesium transporter